MTAFAKGARLATNEMRALFEQTPLQRNAYLSALFDCEVFLKREDLSPVRSYKIRGAFNAMRKRLEADTQVSSFVCASAGNHAQGVAYACRHFGVKGVIFMPITTPQQKIDKTHAFGGSNIQVKLIGDYFDQTLAAAQSYCAETGGYFLSPFDDVDVIEGQASVGIELLDQLQRAPEIVVLPVGGGGLSAGVKQILAAETPSTVLHFVEPTGGASLKAALEAGEPVTLPHVDNFVDGAAVARIGENTFAHLNDSPLDRVHASPEGRICATMIRLLNVEGIVLEPAGALSIDVLDELRSEIRGKTIVCVTSGGNFDFERLPDVKERAMRFEGLKKYYVLRMPQRPGALKEFLGLLGPDDDIARFEYLKKSARNFGSVLIGIESKGPSAFNELERRMTKHGFDHRDITDDEVLAGVLI